MKKKKNLTNSIACIGHELWFVLIIHFISITDQNEPLFFVYNHHCCIIKVFFYLYITAVLTTECDIFKKNYNILCSGVHWESIGKRMNSKYRNGLNFTSTWTLG